MTIDLDALLELAKQATPGPWHYSPWHIEEGPSAVKKKGFGDEWYVATTSSDADAAFIAAANPQTLIELVDELQAFRRLVRERP